MSNETVRERQQWAITKANEKQQRIDEAAYTEEVKTLLRIGLDIFQSKPIPTLKEPAIRRKPAIKAVPVRAMKPKKPLVVKL